jgi:hypothetical protein
MKTKTTDEQIAEMCVWLKKNRMVGRTTLDGKLTIQPVEELIYEQWWSETTGRTQSGL